ncbi:MAG: phosphoenolpyruvate--protein phosphotransferase [Candidatus Schekmanbacteria bacterium]|nr:phosphoenolpyruvate--protein phosphotransferase [Candidatus Schekmanbacteria bacterium]
MTERETTPHPLHTPAKAGSGVADDGRGDRTEGNGPRPTGSGREEIYLKGIGVSPGIAIAKAMVLESQSILVRRNDLPANAVEPEIARFREAVQLSKTQLLAVKQRLAEDVGLEHAYIFDAHLTMLDDLTFTGQVENRIRSELVNAEHALHDTIRHFTGFFATIDDPLIRERGSDINDVGNRILLNLAGERRRSLANLEFEAAIVAKDLAPSDTATMNRRKVRGLVTMVGGKTSHSAIMARALEIPAVVGVDGLLDVVRNGDAIILDGLHGDVVVRPSNDTFQRYLERQRRYKYFERELLRGIELPTITTDGYTMRIAANIELMQEISSVTLYRARGIGLYRTEFLFMNRAVLPSEDEQYETYTQLVKAIQPDPVVIRTLDLGGDKFLSSFSMPKGVKGLSGLRAIRLSLSQVDMFKAQLRAILRASAHGNAKIMFPMISGVGELKAAKEVLESAKEDLTRAGIAFGANVPLGVMIEVPSAAVAADILAREVDFFSIGSNDLIQYTLAIDRISEEVAYLYEPLHPAVLRLIRHVIDVAHRQGIWVAMCGEMASDPTAAVVLLGMGLDEMSMNPVSIPRIKRVIRSVSFQECADLAEEVLLSSTAQEAQDLIRRRIGGRLVDAVGAPEQ